MAPAGCGMRISRSGSKPSRRAAESACAMAASSSATARESKGRRSRRLSQTSSQLCPAPASRIQKSLHVAGSQLNIGGVKRMASRSIAGSRRAKPPAQARRAVARRADARRPNPAPSGQVEPVARPCHALAVPPRPRGGHLLQNARETSSVDARHHGWWSLCDQHGGRDERDGDRGEGGSARTSPSGQSRPSATTHLSLPP